MSNQPVLALDVGGSSVKSALVTNSQHIVGEVHVDDIQSGASAPEILNTLAAIVSALVPALRGSLGAQAPLFGAAALYF